MAAIIKIHDIDEAISNLRYKNKDTLKYKLVHAIRQYYTNEGSSEFLQYIDTEELVKILWYIGDDPALIKSKKKNLSSVKSSINTDLKKLYQEGKNPQGVIIGQNNLFDMSDEAKDKALGTIADVLKEKGADTIAQITEVLKTVNDILSDSGSFLNVKSGSETVDRMKSLILDLSRKIGFSFPGDTGAELGTIDNAVGNNGEERAGTKGEDVVDEIVDEIVDEGDTNVSVEVTDEILDAVGVDVSEETIEEMIDEVGTDLSEQVADEILEEGLIEELDQDVEDEIIDEVADQIQIGGMGEAIDDLTENGSIEETFQGTKGTEGEGGLGKPEVDTVEDIQDYQQESETLDEADSAEVCDEDVVIDEIAEVEPDELPVNEPPLEGELEEIDADSALAEIEGEELLDEEAELVDEVVEEDFHERAEILAKLAEAAKVLEKLGPDLSGSVYSEKEIKEKAKFLFEEFDRELSIREKFYNQHILIKSGEYLIGGRNGGKNELSEQIVRIPDFYIGKFPVTNVLFEIFVEKTGYRTTAERRGYGFIYTPRGQRLKDSITGVETFSWSSHLQYKKLQGASWYQPNGPGSSLHNKRRHPVVQVSLEDARAFAAWTGKRIPKEMEWEAAARTSRGYIYPWGNQWKNNSCNIEKSYFGDTTPVDNYLEFANDFGVVDTLGNILEWTLDLWGSSQSVDKNTEIYVVKGGSWISDSSISLSSRYQMDKNTSSNILGFRCIAI